MPSTRSVDVLVAGGGLAGSTLAGILAGAGLEVLLIEKEPRFRDRVRGEVVMPWGVAEARRAGCGEILDQVGHELPVLDVFQNGAVVESQRWADDSIDDQTAVGFSHPHLQETAFAWAQTRGADVLRPAKVTAVTPGETPTVTVAIDGHEVEYRARLVVGADGKQSAARRWLGAETLADAEHHRFGGVALAGVKADDAAIGYAPTPGLLVAWLRRGPNSTRVYLRLTADRVTEIGVSRSVDAFVRCAAQLMPPGALDDVEQDGPIAFFPNSDVWSSRVAGEHIVLIGDAAGAVDPTQGLGTSLLFRDVRELTELLLAESDWNTVIREYAVRREGYYDVLRAYDRWSCAIEAEEGAEADRRRELHSAAREQDPALGGFGTLEAWGPDGLVADEAARRVFFGEPAT